MELKRNIEKEICRDLSAYRGERRWARAHVTVANPRHHHVDFDSLSSTTWQPLPVLNGNKREI